MKYEIIYYCDVLGVMKVIENGLSLSVAEQKVKELNYKKKWDKNAGLCCMYFLQPEDNHEQ